MDFMIFLQALYFILPAYFANIIPVLVKKINFLAWPVDFGKKLGKNYLFGSHKTWRGLFFATLGGFVFFYVQRLLYQLGVFQNLSLIDYNAFPFWFGALLGFGAIFGDLMKSFFKRRLSIAPGKRWVPFDQIDLVIGALVFSLFYYVADFWIWAYLCIVTIPLHIIFKYLGYWSGISKQKW